MTLPLSEGGTAESMHSSLQEEIGASRDELGAKVDSFFFFLRERKPPASILHCRANHPLGGRGRGNQPDREGGPPDKSSVL